MNPLQPEQLLLPASETMLGEGMTIRRALPTRLRRKVGPWCFLDHFGPVDVSHGDGMRVGPHPHIGLQTVTWLYEGEILHRDSLGYVQSIVPGQLNLMTSGSGISHSEESPHPHPAGLHGLQFWIALPESARCRPAAFNHYAELPSLRHQGLDVTVIVGDYLGGQSPAQLYSPAVGLDLRSPGPAQALLPLRPDFEYAALVTIGSAEIDGVPLVPGTLLYLGGGRDSLQLRAPGALRMALIGGEPMGEEILMWWNFVARNKDEITQAVDDWNAGRGGFGRVQGYNGAPLKAPAAPWMQTS